MGELVVIGQYGRAMMLLFVMAAVGASQQLRPFELKAESVKFWEVIAQDTKLDKVAGGFGFTEGPVWNEKGFLYVSDEEKNTVSRVYPDGRVADGSTFDSKHHLINCASVLRAIIEIAPDGPYKVLADKYDGKKFNSPNDVVLGPNSINTLEMDCTLRLTWAILRAGISFGTPGAVTADP